MDLYLIYICIVSFICFVMYAIDKRKAIKNKWRISEKTLLLFSFIGGAIGAIFAMYGIRHKNKHWYFVFINFISFFIHVILGYFIYLKVGFIFI